MKSLEIYRRPLYHGEVTKPRQTSPRQSYRWQISNCIDTEFVEFTGRIKEKLNWENCLQQLCCNDGIH